MKYLKIGIVTATLMVAAFFATEKKAEAAIITNNVYLEVGEVYTITVSDNTPVLDYASGNKAAGYNGNTQISTASISGKKVSMKAVAQGTCTFYVCNGNNNDSNRTRQITVHSYAESSENLYMCINNNISQISETNTTTLNANIYCYAGNSFTANGALTDWGKSTGAPSSIATNAGGAEPFVFYSLYECADEQGTLISENGEHYLKAGAFSNGVRTFTVDANKVKNLDSATITYLKATGYWTSSNGTKHWAIPKIRTVYCYPKPYMSLTDYRTDKGGDISTLDLAVGCDFYLYGGFKNAISSATTNFNEWTATTSDSKKIIVDNSVYMVYNLKPLKKTSSPVSVTLYMPIKDSVTPHNGQKYTTLSKTIKVTVDDLQPVKKLKATSDENTVTLTWDESKWAVGYEIYRGETPNGEYKLIKKIDNPSQLIYFDKELEFGKKYYYRIKSLSQTSGNDSSLSEMVSVMVNLRTPEITSVYKLKKGHRIYIEGSLYSGFEIYEGSRLVASTTTYQAKVELKKGIHNFKVRAFYNLPNKKLYSPMSKTVKYIVDKNGYAWEVTPTSKPLKPVISKISKGKVRKKKLTLTVSMESILKMYDGTKFEVKVSCGGLSKTVKSKSSAIKVKKLVLGKKYTVKVRVVKNIKVGKTIKQLYSAWAKKKVKTK